MPPQKAEQNTITAMVTFQAGHFGSPSSGSGRFDGRRGFGSLSRAGAVPCLAARVSSVMDERDRKSRNPPPAGMYIAWLTTLTLSGECSTRVLTLGQPQRCAVHPDRNV